MPTKRTAAADSLNQAREELTKACNDRRQTRDRLVAACSSVLMTQSGFSDGDDWTREDEMRARCLEPMFSVINDLAAQLVKANEAHERQLAFLNKLRDSQRKTEP